MSKGKFPKKPVSKHFYPKPRKFWAKGTVYTRLEIPGMPSMEGWTKTEDQVLFEYLPKQFSQDIAFVRDPKFGPVYGKGLAEIKHPYIRSRGGFMSVDHLEVFVSGSAKIR